MKLSKICGLIISILIIVCTAVGCSGYSSKNNDGAANANTQDDTLLVQKAEDTDTAEEQIKEDIIGSWHAGSGYMSFFDNGEMGMFSTKTGNGEMMEYYVDGTTVILNADAGEFKLSSVEIKDGQLIYISEQGHKNVWNAVSSKEVASVMESMK